MQVKITEITEIKIAFIDSEELLITDSQSALDLIVTVNYGYQSNRIVVKKTNICEDFFKLSTGIAGDILQKFSTYKAKIVIIGDFSKYTSKPLQDFIRESNKGTTVFFVNDKTEAIDKLSKV
ncbi:MAG: DUF4180 domain-containing protein [Ruminococcus sp.]|jgi:hypothetical protein|nr:DUF4180 domain-containing protein [Ruminococcus sp.]